MNQSNTPLDQKQSGEKATFFLKNLMRGLVWLVAIVGGYYFLESHYGFSLETILGPFYEKPVVIFSLFLGSEVIFGIIPPELFMIWSLRHEVLNLYIQNIVALAIISYLAGVIGYFIGSRFGTTQLYQTLKKNYLGKFEKHFNRFGGFLVIVAALTPLPFSGICMLMGAVKYPMKNFLYISLTRFIRFSVYAFIVWEANILQ
ncbi:MAG: VTT domain-containing protein [Cyclobacteriaceae bacterium]